MDLCELGQSLKAARISKEITQQALAERTGVSISTISGLERGTLSEIGVVKLLQLFAVVGLELQPRTAGQRRTLDDVANELAGRAPDVVRRRSGAVVPYDIKAFDVPAKSVFPAIRQRVRASAKKTKK
jgi:transcriptional regulator with XRE-family HTH domain